MTTETLTQHLIGRLWSDYCQRVPYARTYAELVQKKGGTVVNDHCAFWTFNTPTGQQLPGLEAIGHVLESLGFFRKKAYQFSETHLYAYHYEHPNIRFPKFFVSQLEVHELPEATAFLIQQAVGDAPNLLADLPMHWLMQLEAKGEISEPEAAQLLDALVLFFQRPWQPPLRSTVEAVRKVSEYAAWTLLYGNSVNHFTAYVNRQNVAEWPTIDATAKALAAAGVPMQSQTQSAPDSKLVQISTQPVVETVDVREANGSLGKIKWPYSFYELAERGTIEQNGERILFNGFLGEQVINSFEVIKMADSQ